MESDRIPLKEDSSFEILQLLDDDEIPLEKIHDPKDEIEYVVTEKKDYSSNNIFKWTKNYTNPKIEYNGTYSNNFSSIAVESALDPVTLYNIDVEEIENIGCYYPVSSSFHDKMITSYGFKSSETDGSGRGNAKSLHKRKDNVKTKADRPCEILVISTGPFNHSEVERQHFSKEFLNHGNHESVPEQYSSWISRTEQRNETQSGNIVCEEVFEDDRTLDLLSRNTCNRKLSQLVDNGIEFCSWLQSRKCVQRFVKKAKASFRSIAKTVELEINQILGSENPIRLSILSDGLSAQAIEEAFTEVFRGHVIASLIRVDMDTIPALPIGSAAGLQAAEMKINHARQCNLVLEGSVVISTSVLLQEAVSHRWQMMTVICVDDPDLTLNLHNFTATTPIPNQYVIEAERQTSPDYPLRHYGLAVDIKSAVAAVSKVTPEDTQEFLTGVSCYSTVKSAALVLAGIYKKYAIRCT